ncbi:type VI secretion system protein [Paraburkholderia sp. GAS448]|uniref:type VI secretion system-associated FHA domain protein TagH n=1 Tax=Paraburkholderia sp. GAS448 TaxID=3035136 RepID=UPI003D1CD448
MQSNYPMLLLRVAAYNDAPLAEPITVEFGPTGGTIGRATTCTLVLPDQQRAISRVHARVEFRAGDYLLCDLGSNPSVLNQRALGGTREARLTDGDRLLIGAYLLEVTLAERGAGLQGMPGAHDPLASAQVLSGAAPQGAQGDPFSSAALDPLGQPGFGGEPRISSQPGFAGSESDHVSPEWQAFSAPVPAAMPQTGGGQAPATSAAAPLGGGIPADYDPLADALAQWESPQQPAHPSPPPMRQHEPADISSPFALPPFGAPHAAPTDLQTGAPIASPTPPGGPTGLPASLLDGPATGGGATPFDDLFAATPAAKPSTPGFAIPPTAFPGDAASAPHAMPPAAPAPTFPAAATSAATPAAAPAAFGTASGHSPAPAPVAAPAPEVEPEPAVAPAREAPASAAPATSSATPSATSSDSAVTRALVEGLGLDPSRAPNLPAPELARLTGVMLREALRGAMAVLRSRSMTKREARLDVTLIVARDNNPLKFFPDVDSALAQMLTGRGAGYLPPAEALERAFDDIESHELAVIVGMRAALAHVLGRFDPALIEKQLKEQGLLDKVLSNRKAKLWDRFVELQAGIAREAEDDFQKLFGEAFNDAYEAQIDALRNARKAGKTDPADKT